MRVGDIVHHPIYGRGYVLCQIASEMPAGIGRIRHRYRVRFADCPRPVWADDLTTAPPIGEPTPPRFTPHLVA